MDIPATRVDETRSVALIRALPGIGDLLCAVPALRALRSALPEARLVLVGLPGNLWFLKRFGTYLDGLVEFPGYPGIPERAFDAPRFDAFMASVHQAPFDLAIQMHGSGLASNPFTALLGARATAGFYLPGQYCPDPETFLPYPAHEPEVRRHLLLLEHLGVPLEGEDLEFPINEGDRCELQALAEGTALRPGSYVCLHPGASIVARRWSAEGFAALGDRLSEEGFDVVITGTQSERTVAGEVSERMKRRSLDLSGHTSLGGLAALIAGARLLVCNDTGVSHLAAALDVPSVVVFTASDPERWAPLNRARHRVLQSWSAELNPCQHVRLPNEHRCLRDACVSPLRIVEKRGEAVVRTETIWSVVLDILSEGLTGEAKHAV